MTPTMSPTARFLDEAIRNSSRTQAEIAARAGFPTPNVPSMMKLGQGGGAEGLLGIEFAPAGEPHRAATVDRDRAARRDFLHHEQLEAQEPVAGAVFLTGSDTGSQPPPACFS